MVNFDENFLQTSMNVHIQTSTNVLQTLHVKILRVLTRVNVQLDICCLLISGHVTVSYLLPVKHFIARKHSYLISLSQFGTRCLVVVSADTSSGKICRFEWLSYWENVMFIFSYGCCCFRLLGSDKLSVCTILLFAWFSCVF